MEKPSHEKTIPENWSRDSSNDAGGHNDGVSVLNILGGQDFADGVDDDDAKRSEHYAASRNGPSCPSKKKGALIHLSQLYMKLSEKQYQELVMQLKWHIYICVYVYMKADP